MRLERVIPGRRTPARLVGAILTRDLRVGGTRWPKGRRLSADDLAALAAADPADPVTVIVAEPGELHEDEAAIRLAQAVGGGGLATRGPNESRVDLVAAAPGVVNVRVAELERLDRIDPLEVFTVFDGQIVAAGDLVASVKVAPHVVDAAVVDAGARIAEFGSRPLVWVAPFIPGRVAVIVKQSVRGTARDRFEASVRAKVEGLGSTVSAIDYVEDDLGAVESALAVQTRGDDPADVVARRPDRRARTRVTRSSSRSMRSAAVSSVTASRPTRGRCCGWPASVGRRSSGCRRAARTRRRPLPTCCCPGCSAVSRPPNGRSRSWGTAGS